MSAVAVIVCAWTEDRWPVLSRAVAAVSAQVEPGDEIVLVVDHNPRLLTRCAEAWPQARVLASAGARGLSAARNTGVAASTALGVVFLDDDAVPRPGWLAALRARLSAGAAMVGGAVEADWELGAQPAWWPDEFGWVVGCDYRGLPGDGESIRNPIGASMAISRAALELAGPFSEDLGRTGSLPAGCEETEMGIRVREGLPGAVIVRDTTAVVDHLVPAARARLGYFVRRCWGEGRSKAILARAVGADSALASERAHTVRMLTGGLRRYAVALAPSRAVVMLLGLAVTTLGFVRGSLTRPVGVPPAPAADAFLSIPVCDLDLDDDTLPLPVPNARGQVHLLLRRRGWPVGQVLLDGLVPGPMGHLGWVEACRFPRSAGDPDTSRGIFRPLCASFPGQPGKPTVSVVVCTLGRNPRLLDTVRAVLGQSGPMDELVVADNDPASGRARTMLAAVDDPRLRFVDEPRPGASAARNAGARAATGTMIAFTDDDAVPDHDWTARAVDVLAASDEISCVIGLVVPAGFETADQVRFEDYGGFGKGYATSVWHPGRREAEVLTAVDAVAQAHGSPYAAVRGHRGAAFPFTAGEFGSGVACWRATAFRALGGFDPALGPGTPAQAGEDLDLCRAAYLSGGTVVLHPALVVRHHHRSGYDDLRGQVFGYGVGLTAALTKLVVTRPSVLIRVALRMPAAAAMLLSPSSTKNAALPADFPADLVRAERRGVLAGPWRYLRSRRVASRWRE